MAGKYSIGQFSKKTGTTIRTLHYYDEIGLLEPTEITGSGRRYYSDPDFTVLQRIVTLKYLGYSLEQIKGMLQNEKWSLKDSLAFQRAEMIRKKEEVEGVIRALDRALYVMEDQNEVDAGIFISLINTIHREDEQKEWLKSFLPEERVDSIYAIPEEKQREYESRWVSISMGLKELAGSDPASGEVQALIEAMMEIVDEISGNDPSLLKEISSVDLSDEDDGGLFHIPFSPKEEEWLAAALGLYLEQKGMNVDDEK
ncbi:MerR family transcriptional regulator [Bacillus infantis]|uniref:MerR family transcriptional regulator n=1 Tax=Bacillus infantis TaxID=324767 RepID=UPI00101CF339|nr:MerR family transcriptional regulator [Bacillus infantis]RYI28531.1 MerR family transcriptional regulator [Bacillus infantis]